MLPGDDLKGRAHARLGTLLNGKWRLDAVLGLGGMATVYAATHRNQKRVAIKLLHPEVSIDHQVTSRFTREGYVANTVGHPGAVSVLDDDVAEDGSAFLVMELLEGETLDGRRERLGKLPPMEVLFLAEQILDVLVAAHEKGILHRDLKPENLLLTKSGQVKVLDFGIARLHELASPQTPSSTRSGSLLGTPAFMAPEQARGRWQEVDARTDLWAVGATMYTLLTGHFVHEAETINEQLIQTAIEPAPSIAQRLPNLHPAVVALVDRALAYERGERWQSAREFQNAVRHARASLSLVTPGATPTPFSTSLGGGMAVGASSYPGAETAIGAPTETGPPFMREVGRPAPRKVRRLAWAGAAGALALFAVGGALYALRPSSVTPEHDRPAATNVNASPGISPIQTGTEVPPTQPPARIEPPPAIGVDLATALASPAIASADGGANTAPNANADKANPPAIGNGRPAKLGHEKAGVSPHAAAGASKPSTTKPQAPATAPHPETAGAGTTQDLFDKRH